MQRGGIFESSAESSAVQTATGGGQSSVQRQLRHEQRGNVTMSERSQIESESTHEAGAQSAVSRSAQQFDRHEKGARRLDGGGVEHSEDTYNKMNERSEAQSKRELPGGEETSQSSSVSKSETRQTASVADLGGGATHRQSVTKRSQLSQVSEVSETTTSSSRASRPEPRRLATGGRSSSLQSEHLSDTLNTAGGRGGAIPTPTSTSASTRVGGGGILRELERLLADEDRYERARRAVRRDDTQSLNVRSDQIRREVDNLVATFFDRKRDRVGRADFFDSASRRAEQLARDFARDTDDPWKGEEERWRRQRELRRTGSEDFFEDAVHRAEALVREMRDRKERRRRDEEDIFSRFGAEIDQFFGSSGSVGGGRRQEECLGSRRGPGDRSCSASAFTDDLVRDFLQDNSSRSAEDLWGQSREREDFHSTHVDIDEVLSQASTAGRERAARPARPNTSDVDIEELSASSRRARPHRPSTTGADRLVDDIVRQFIADDFEDEGTLRGRPREMDRQTSNTSTLDEAASLRSESRMSEVDEELRHAEQRRQEEKAELVAQHAEEQRQQQWQEAQAQQLAERQVAEAEREERERRRQEQQEGNDAHRRHQLEALEQAERQAEQYRQEREQRCQKRAAQEQQVDEELTREKEQTERRRRALDKALAERSAQNTVTTQQEQVVNQSCSRQASGKAEQSSPHQEQQSVTAVSSAADEQQREWQTPHQHGSISGLPEQLDELAADQREDQPARATIEAADRTKVGGEADAVGGAEETAVARSEASAAALHRAEELLFGFVPDWEREEQRWSQVRTERIAEASGEKKARDLLADYKPLRHARDDDLRAQRLHERKTEEYEHLMSGDVWRGLKDGQRGGGARPATSAADSVLSELRSTRQSTANSAQSARSQFSARMADSMRESLMSERSSSKASRGRNSKLDEFKSFKSELWQEK